MDELRLHCGGSRDETNEVVGAALRGRPLPVAVQSSKDELTERRGPRSATPTIPLGVIRCTHSYDIVPNPHHLELRILKLTQAFH
jgi:hypothetical protein